VPRHLTWCQEQGIWLGHVWPQAGDLIFFDFGGGPASHIGIVESVDGDSETVNTIEGNWLNQVVRRHYASDDWRILGYARPRYDARAGSVATGSEAGGANRLNGCVDVASDLDEVAWSVIRGDWGDGQERAGAAQPGDNQFYTPGATFLWKNKKTSKEKGYFLKIRM